MRPCWIYTSSSVQLMLNVTFPSPIIYEVHKHVSSLAFPFRSPPTYIYHKYLRGWMFGGGGGFNICPIWNVSGPSSGRHAVDKAPNRFVWDVRLYYGCLFYLLAPTRTQLPLNVYSRRIGLLIQVSRTLWKMKVTDSVSPGFRVAL